VSDWRPSATPAALRLRARLHQWLRAYFAARGVLEVETPMMSAAGNTEPNIESFRTSFNGHAAAGAAQRWLRTSPEYPMKRLLAAGIGDCYEIGRVFRNGEAGGRHNPEFTMLEWYRIGWDHHRLMVEVGELIRGALALVERAIDVRALSYRELFVEFAGLDPHQCDDAALRAPLAEFAIRDEGLSRDDWLDLLLTHRIEPQLRDDTLLLVHDYPASQAALARIRPGTPPVAERFEAMLGGIELANGYHELADPGEQGERLQADLARRRGRGAIEPPPDTRLIDALAHGLPDCAGVALGLDRLLMAMLGTNRIADVLAFDFPRA